MFTREILFWGFLVVYGIIMLIISPKKVSTDGFFKGNDNNEKQVSFIVLTSSIYISWIFAKSVTNAANLGLKYGVVGGMAYAIYWLCIPLAGFVIYRLRRKYGARGIVSFLTSNYGIFAAFSFSAAILIRLFNEIWSNSSVIGGYYGESGSNAFIISATVFTIITLVYSVMGGLRSSLVTDFIQTILFAIILIFILVWILPNKPVEQYIVSGTWELDTGVDMLLVSVLQIFSYPFHDPVLTDRGFISDDKKMLKAFIVSGVLGFVTILLFSFIGIDAAINGLNNSSNVPADISKAMGLGSFFLMAVLMISAAGSTLDSTFSSLAKLSAVDLPKIFSKDLGNKARKIGIIVMIVFAFVGNLPMIVGTDILKATTISGTMVIGLAPIFILHGIVKPTKVGFHLSFWTGIILGIVSTLGKVPNIFHIGSGDNSMLLGVNLYGLILCTLFYVVSGVVSKLCENSIKKEENNEFRKSLSNRL